MGFEPTTTCLGSKDSTTELRPPLATEEPNPTLEPRLSQESDTDRLRLVFRHGELSAADAYMKRLANR